MNSKQDDPFIKLAQEVILTVASMENRDGIKPTFEDYVDEMLDAGIISINNLETEIRAHALAWSGAKLGVSNWKNTFNKIQKDIEDTNTIMKNQIKSNHNCKEDDSKVKKLTISYKAIRFTQSLFKEIDNEVVKLFKHVGILKIVLIGVLILILWGLSSLIDQEYGFISVLILVCLVTLGLYILQLNENSKIRLVTMYILGIAGMLYCLAVIISLGWGIFDFLKDAFNWVVDLFK